MALVHHADSTIDDVYADLDALDEINTFTGVRNWLRSLLQTKDFHRINNDQMDDGLYESLITTASVEKEDHGKTFGLNLAGGFTVTLPTAAQAGAGWKVTFRVEIAPTTAYIITEDAGTDTNVLSGGVAELEVDTANDGPYSAAFTQVNFVASVAAVGDYIDVECNGTRFFVRGLTNLDGGITLT